LLLPLSGDYMASDMPKRVSEGVKFVCWAPSRNGGQVPVEVQRLTRKHVDVWVKNIQPVIEKLPKRPDANWRWKRITSINWLPALLQSPVAFALCVSHEHEDVPCLLIQLAAKFPALDEGKASCVFVWYVAAPSLPTCVRQPPGRSLV
jgi:hypothetical protein